MWKIEGAFEDDNWEAAGKAIDETPAQDIKDNIGYVSCSVARDKGGVLHQTTLNLR